MTTNELDDDNWADEHGICRCFECQTYYNDDVDRPIIEVDIVEYIQVKEFLRKPEIADYIKKYREKTSKHILMQDNYFICRVDKSKFHGSSYKDHETMEQITVSYKYPSSRRKYTVTIDTSGWNRCRYNTWT